MNKLKFTLVMGALVAVSGLLASVEVSAQSKSHKIHNPAKDAKKCVRLVQSGYYRNWSFVNECSGTVEVFWCFVQTNGSCRHGGTWSVAKGISWPTQEKGNIRWGACMGKNSGGMDDGSNGMKYTCNEW